MKSNFARLTLVAGLLAASAVAHAESCSALAAAGINHNTLRSVLTTIVPTATAPLAAAEAAIGQALDADEAAKLGLVTAALDDIDWADEVRLVLEERASMSPDALTGMEANLRFAGKENMATRVFGRLSAWQNWIFIRPNATGEKGALKVYGKGEKAAFDWNRV